MSASCRTLSCVQWEGSSTVTGTDQLTVPRHSHTWFFFPQFQGTQSHCVCGVMSIPSPLPSLFYALFPSHSNHFRLGFVRSIKLEIHTKILLENECMPRVGFQMVPCRSLLRTRTFRRPVLIRFCFIGSPRWGRGYGWAGDWSDIPRKLS